MARRDLNHCCQAKYTYHGWWCGLCRRTYELIMFMQRKQRASNAHIYETYLRAGISLGVRSENELCENVLDVAFRHGYLCVILYVARAMKIALYDHEHTGDYNNVVSITYGKFWMFRTLNKLGLMPINVDSWRNHDIRFAVEGYIHGRAHLLPYIKYMVCDASVMQPHLSVVIHALHNNYSPQQLSTRYMENSRAALWILYDATYVRYQEFMARLLDTEDFKITQAVFESIIMWYVMGFEHSNDLMTLALTDSNLDYDMLTNCVEYLNLEQLCAHFTSRYDDQLTVDTQADNQQYAAKLERLEDATRRIKSRHKTFHDQIRGHLKMNYGKEYEYWIMQFVCAAH